MSNLVLRGARLGTDDEFVNLYRITGLENRAEIDSAFLEWEELEIYDLEQKKVVWRGNRPPEIVRRLNAQYAARGGRK